MMRVRSPASSSSSAVHLAASRSPLPARSTVTMDWQTGGTIVGVAAVLYGFTVAFGLRAASARVRSRVVVWGGIIVLALAIVLVLLPFLKVY